jgi:DNA-binding transcriptional ArsR family regulator
VTAGARGLKDLDDLELVFGALAHQSRRTILSVLLARGGEMTSGAIAARFDCSWPTTTRHLRILEEAGLVRVVLHGRERIYRLDLGRLHGVAGSWIRRFDPPAGDDCTLPSTRRASGASDGSPGS